jgi:predicted enzyme related to lactoylglutathione lyase
MSHKHPIVHIEIPADDDKAAAKFYNSVFEWNITEIPDMNYVMFSAEGGTGGAFNPVSEENPVGNILLYINTPNLKESLAKIKANGGTVVLESYEIATVGTMAIFKDPTGNRIALLEPIAEM